MSFRFKLDRDSGLLHPARQVPSPNRDERPAGLSPTLIVIHGISLPPGQFGGREIEALFCNQLDWDAHPYFDEIRGLEVSAHLLIRRNGEVLQFVPGIAASPGFAAKGAAMIFPSASSSKAKMKRPIPTRNTRVCRPSLVQCSRDTRQ